MAELNDQQLATLTSGGDSFDHYHSTDRVVSHNTLARLQELATVRTVTAPYTFREVDSFVVVSNGGTITLPRAINGREAHVTMFSASSVTVAAVSPDLINGAATIVISTQWKTLNFKAVPTGWIVF